jgi:hypothetical protein
MIMDSDSETSDTEISMFSETATSEEEEEENNYEELQMLLASQFPKSPFNIDCVRDLEELDTVFSYESVILIYDDRLNQKYYNLDDMSVSQKNKLRHYTVVKSMNDDPITLRQVLNTMIKDRHYNSRTIEKHFGHYYLEKFVRHINNKFETVWGN